jgi:hypothetical protein
MCQSNKSIGINNHKMENFEQTASPALDPAPAPPYGPQKNLNIEWSKKAKVTTASPEINGPPFWFTLHNGAAHLPKNISPISMHRIRGFIDGIPEMQPCLACSEHARTYIEKNKSKIEQMSTGDEVFAFFVDFHNFVNKRLGKKLVSVQEAKAMYSGGENVSVMTYA